MAARDQRPFGERRGFRNPARARHAVMLASVIGLERASKRTGISPSQISTWRTRLERLTGERLPRLRRGNRLGSGKLNAAKARKIRAARRRGVSWGVLARIYRVSPTACVKVCRGQLYPEAA